MNDAGEKPPRSGWNAARTLWLVAAAAAFAAWAIDWFKDGKVRTASMVLGLVCLTLAFTATRRK